MRLAHPLGHRFATATFPESRHGIYVCGINWGGRDDDAMAALVRRRASFFSDDAAGTYRYRERILRWFELWGSPLARSNEVAGAFERAVSQVNWLKDRSERSEHRTQPAFLLAHLEQLLEVLREGEPRVVLFFGSCLGVALARATKQPASLLALERTAGALLEPAQTITRSGADGKALTVRRAAFARTLFLAFPHPTGAVGVTNEQVARFAPEVHEAIAFWRAGRALP